MSTAPAPRPVGPVAAALRSERVKVTTVRSTPALLGAGALVGLLIAWASASFITDRDLAVVDVFLFPSVLTAVLAAVGGVLLFTSEVQHGTLAGAFAAHPARWPVVVAKAVVAVGLGLALGGAGLVTGVLGGLVAGAELGSTAGLAPTLVWALLFPSGAALLGLGVGMAVRHSAGAVSGLLVWWLVVEGSIASFAPQVVRFVPFDAGFRTLGVYAELDPPEVVAASLSRPASAAVFGAYVVAVLAVGTVLALRRDVD